MMPMFMVLMCMVVFDKVLDDAAVYDVMCMVLMLFDKVPDDAAVHGIVLFDLYCMISHRTVLHCMVLYGIAFY